MFSALVIDHKPTIGLCRCFYGTGELVRGGDLGSTLQIVRYLWNFLHDECVVGP